MMQPVVFANKNFQGATYSFGHLSPTAMQVFLNAAQTVSIGMHVTYSCHCFTEEFDEATHLDHHRYTHGHETRAFSLERYECSLQLPNVINTMLRGTVYRAKNNNYTYVAQLVLPGTVAQPYSVFFDMQKDRNADAENPAVRMFIQSAYLKPLAASTAQNWRFGSLAGQIAGVFQPPQKKPKPQKKKAP